MDNGKRTHACDFLSPLCLWSEFYNTHLQRRRLIPESNPAKTFVSFKHDSSALSFSTQTLSHSHLLRPTPPTLLFSTHWAYNIYQHVETIAVRIPFSSKYQRHGRFLLLTLSTNKLSFMFIDTRHSYVSNQLTCSTLPPLLVMSSY